MLNFEDIEELVDYMFENLDDKDNIISVIANKDMILNIMHELYNYNNVIINTCDIEDKFDYDKEYRLSLYNDVDEENWYVDIIPIYDAINDRYSASDGFTLFHEDVNSKAMIDMQNNENVELSGHDWFTVGEEEESDNDDGDEDTNADAESTYTVNGKSVDKETFDEYVSKFAPDLVDENTDASDDGNYSISVKYNLDADEALEIIADMERRMIHMNDMFREMDNFRRLFNW